MLHTLDCIQENLSIAVSAVENLCFKVLPQVMVRAHAKPDLIQPASANC